jgi:hypothetical protein
MSREILYKKTSFIEDKSKEFLERIKKENQKNFEKTHDSIMGKSKNEGILSHISNSDSKNLIDWLKNHPLINISALCREANINRSNFDKSLKMDSIPEKHEKILIDILKKYGYKK